MSPLVPYALVFIFGLLAAGFTLAARAQISELKLREERSATQHLGKHPLRLPDRLFNRSGVRNKRLAIACAFCALASLLVYALVR